jgi:type I restriction enzyme S subunit
MKAERLIALHERVADAPDAVSRLRSFVLDLAIRGKLVPQDAMDEPASAQLARIAAKRAALAGNSRKQNRLLVQTTSDMTFELPASWATARIGDLVRILNGRAYKQAELLSEGTPVLRVGNLFTSSHWYYSDLELDEDKYCDQGELIYAWSASFGPFIWKGPKVIFHYHIWKLSLFSSSDLDQGFLYLQLLQKTREIKEAGRGISMVHMTKEKMEQIVLSLPPLAEQQRIVAKVDELMALLDRLEAARHACEATRDRLAAATLARLTASDTSAEEAAANARFALNTLPALTTRPDQIKPLRQTILNLAVRGQLVPSNGGGKDRRTVPLGELLSEGTRNGYSRRPDDAVEGTPILRISAGTVRQDGFVAEEEHKLISGIDQRTREQYSLKPGDLLACRFNGNKAFVGRLTLFSDYLGLNPIYPDKLIRVRLDREKALPAYIRIAGESDLVRQQIEGFCATTVGNWGISASNLQQVSFPLPPLTEQQRIVAKVEALMALCDQLEAAVTTANTTRTRLLEALLHHALAPADRELAA